MDDNRIRITRGQLAQVVSALAGIGMLVAILSFIWQGSPSAITIGAIIVGLLGIGLWAILTPQEFIGFITGRQIRQSTISIFSTLLLIGIVTLVYIIVQRQQIIADFTIDNRFTLRPESYDVVDAATRGVRPIEITAFYNPEDVVQREVDDQYFQLYEAASDGYIQTRAIDPAAQPALTDIFLPYLEQGIYIFVSFLNEDGTLDLSTTLPVAYSGRQENDLTTALARLLAQGNFKVYFETSLGTLDPLDNTQQGMSLINNGLRNTGLITEPLSLEELAASGQQIPADASAVIIARPQRDLTAAELDTIAAYLNQGGSLFIGADIFFGREQFLETEGAFNQYLWERFGLRATDYVVVDPASSASTALDIISYAVFSDNVIGANINIEGAPDTATLFEIARVIEVDDDPPVTNGRVIMSSPESWGEANLTDIAQNDRYVYNATTDVPGPLTTVAWAFDEGNGAKIVLVGDGNFMMNGQAQSPIGNTGLVLDSVSWLTGFSEAVEFEPRVFVTTPLLFIDNQALDTIAFITMVLMPGTMLIAAGALWLRRMRQ